MSGAKAGNAMPLGAVALIVPVIAAGALAIGAATMLSLAGKGIFRLGKKTYEAIDEAIEQSVAEDLEIRMKSFEDTFANADNVLDSKELDIAAQFQEEQKIETNNYEKLIEKFTILTEQREQVEKEKQLKPIVSQEFKNALEQFKEEKAKTLTRSKKLKNTTIDKMLQKEMNRIYATINELEPFFPMFVNQKKATITAMDVNKKSVAALSRDVSEKAALIKGDRGRWYKKLAVKYLAMQKSPVYNQMTRGEKQQMDEEYDRTVESMVRCQTGEDAEKSITLGKRSKPLLSKGFKNP